MDARLKKTAILRIFHHLVKNITLDLAKQVILFKIHLSSCRRAYVGIEVDMGLCSECPNDPNIAIEISVFPSANQICVCWDLDGRRNQFPIIFNGPHKINDFYKCFARCKIYKNIVSTDQTYEQFIDSFSKAIIVNNSLLTGITHSPSSQNFTFYLAGNCNLTGNLDLTPLSGLGGNFKVEVIIC